MDYSVYSTVAYPLKRDGTHDWNSVNELDHETNRGVPTKTGKEQANTYQVSFLETLSAKVCHPNNQFSMTVCYLRCNLNRRAVLSILIQLCYVLARFS